MFQKRAPIDLTNARLRRLAAALGPAYVRVSGTWANSVYFQNSDSPPAAAPRGYEGVLTRREWKGVIDFTHATNAALVTSFTISAGVRDASGVWTPVEAQPFVDYSKALGGRIAAAELFNEPTMPSYGAAPPGYNAASFAKDLAGFRSFAKSNVPDMLIVGPGGVGEGLAEGLLPADAAGGVLPTPDLLAASPRPRFDVFSYHFYGAASIRCAAMGAAQTTAGAALSEAFLARTDTAYAFYAKLRDRFEPGKPIWITETADAACGGNPWASTFLDTFRYLDQLGRLAKRGVAVVFHNTLAASEYGLLDQRDFAPRPNYWAALLWRRLMGTTVLDAGPSRGALHLYAHCLRGHPGGVDTPGDQSQSHGECIAHHCNQRRRALYVVFAGTRRDQCPAQRKHIGVRSRRCPPAHTRRRCSGGPRLARTDHGHLFHHRRRQTTPIVDRARNAPAQLSEYADLPEKTYVVVEQILFDDLAVLPSRDRAEFQFEGFASCVVNLAIETRPRADHLSFPFGDGAGPIAGTDHHAVRIVVEMILN